MNTESNTPVAANNNRNWRDLEFDDAPAAPSIIVPSTKIAASDMALGTGPASEALHASGYAVPCEAVLVNYQDGMLSANLGASRAIRNVDTGYCYGFVKEGYRPLQHMALARLVDVAFPDAKVRAHGWDHGSRIAFFVDMGKSFAEVPEGMHIYTYGGNEDFKGEVLGAELMLSNYHGGGGGVKSALRREVEVCRNGMVRKHTKNGCSFSHTKYLEKRLEDLQRAFEYAQTDTEMHNLLLGRMMGTELTQEGLEELLESLWPVVGVKEGRALTMRSKQRDQFNHSYQTAPGAAPGSVWGALQAATYVSSHLSNQRVGGRSAARYRLDMPDEQRQVVARQESNLFGAGSQFVGKVHNWATARLN